MNAHIDTILQASGTTRAIEWVKKPDYAASEDAYRKATGKRWIPAGSTITTQFVDNRPDSEKGLTT